MCEEIRIVVVSGVFGKAIALRQTEIVRILCVDSHAEIAVVNKMLDSKENLISKLVYLQVISLNEYLFKRNRNRISICMY